MPIALLVLYGTIWITLTVIEANKKHKMYRKSTAILEEEGNRIEDSRNRLHVDLEKEREVLDDITNPKKNPEMINSIADEMKYIYGDGWERFKGMVLSANYINNNLKLDVNIIALVYMAKNVMGNVFREYSLGGREEDYGKQMKALHMIEKCMQEANDFAPDVRLMFMPMDFVKEGTEKKYPQHGTFKWEFEVKDRSRKYRLW